MRKHILRSALLVALLTMIFPCFQAAPVQTGSLGPGDLDPSFAGFYGSRGVGIPKGMAVLSDGKFVVLTTGEKMYDFTIARFNSRGSYDPSFNNDGDINLTSYFAPRALAVQGTGDQVVAGDKFRTPKDKGGFQLMRFKSGGWL